jgi:prepilin-type processing-associated H-X9-DG protein
MRAASGRLRTLTYVHQGKGGVLLVNSFASWPLALPILRFWRGPAFWYIHESLDPIVLMREEIPHQRLQALVARGAVTMIFGSDATRAIWARAGYDGLVHQRSGVRPAHVRDGLSNTLFAGEKYLNPTAYETGNDNSDNESAYTGDDRDTLCNCSGPRDRPLQDTPGIGNRFHFGSGHAGGPGFAFADGSVRLLGYDIDPELLRRLAVRNDGQIVELGQ